VQFVLRLVVFSMRKSSERQLESSLQEKFGVDVQILHAMSMML
jgi:hypothetical protein